MGMIMTLVRLSSAKYQEYIDNPEALENDVDDYLSGDTEDTIDLDKSWEAIHFILTGNNIGNGDGPLAKAVCSDQFFDEEQDLGMGPASYLTPIQVKEVNALLEKIDDNFLKEHFNPAEMSKLEVYPGDWESDPDNQFEYITENFIKLQTFYREAAKNGYAITSIAN